MKVALDRKRCEGHGMCESAAPELFTLDDAGELIAHYDGREIPVEFEESARDAVRVCPVAALAIEGTA
jgi:ferredoxin